MRGVVTARKSPTVGHPKADPAGRLTSETGINIPEVFERLFAVNGKQRWWPGDSAFEIMVGAVLTQNTAWTNVKRAIANLIQARALSPEVIVRAHPRRLGKWLRPSGYFNVKARRLKAMCRWLIGAGGIRKIARTPTHELRRALLDVHGIGPETADDILLYAFNRPVFVIDAYTRRIFSRLGLIGGSEKYESLRQSFEQVLEPDAQKFNEFHALIVVHGKNICKKKPRCQMCVLASGCSSSIEHSRC